LSGSPGAGKSNLALEIAKAIDVVIVDHDITKSALLETGLDNLTASKAAWDVGYAYVNYYLSQGRNVIMDSCCFYEKQLERGMEAVKNNNAKYRYVECYLNDLEELNRRLKSRERKTSQLEFITTENFSLWIDDMKKPGENFLVVDTSKPVNTYIKDIIQYLLA
jgi:predicted kinase